MKKLIALTLALLMVVPMFAVLSFADETRDYDGTTYTKLDGYVAAAGHKPEIVEDESGKLVAALAYDFDIAPIKSSDFWDNKDSITFTVVFTPAEGDPITVVEKPVKAEVWNAPDGTDTSIWFEIPAEVANGTYTFTVYVKTADAAYYGEEAGITIALPKNENANGDIDCSVGSATYRYDAAINTLFIVGKDGAVINDKSSYTDFPFGPIASAWAKNVVITGVKQVGKNLLAHYSLLDTVMIGEGCEVLNGDAMAYSSVKTIYIPKTVKSIKQGVVYASNNIAKVYYSGTEGEYAVSITGMGAYNDAFKADSGKVVYETPFPVAALTITPYADGWENWNDQTQLLLKLVADNAFGDTIEAEFLNNAADYLFELTFDDGESVVTKNIAPSSKSGNLLLRFQTCIAPDAFVPTNGKTYKVTLKVYDPAGTTLLYTGVGENFKCAMDPIVPPPPGELTITPYADGWENWHAETQLLLKLVANDEFADEIETEFLNNAANYTFKLTFDDGETVVTKKIAPSSKSGNLLIRFQTAIAADPFVPVNGKTYKVTLNVYDAAETKLLYTGTGENFACKMDPIVPVALDITPYSDGWENWGDPQNTQLLLILKAADEFADAIETEFLTNAANYTFKITFNDGTTKVTKTLVPTSQSGDLLIRFTPCVADDYFVPTKGTTYTITLDVYDAAATKHLYSGVGSNFVCSVDPITLPVYVDDTTVVINEEGVEVKEGEDVVIDAAAEGDDIDSVELSGELIDKVAENAAKKDTAAEIILPDATLDIDAKALAAISEAADGKPVTIAAKTIEETDLNEKQQKALEEEEVVAVISLDMFAGEAKITNFGEGTITVSVPFEVPQGSEGDDFAVAYIDDEGKITVLKTKFDGKNLEFDTAHFSSYVILNVEASNPPTADAAVIATIVVAVALVGMAVAAKKVRV